ncbi:reverse transcriptase domain-containing protein [Tanacetum coccineum]
MVKKEGHQSASLANTEPRKVDLTKEILVNLAYPEQLVTIGGNLSEECVPRRIVEHVLNVNPSIEPVCQKRKVLASDKIQAVSKKVEEWMKARIVRPMKYPTWISNPVLVKKVDGSWRMCIDFKNVNSACPKDYYPLPDINGKMEFVVGFRYKCFLDTYKGYHKVQMGKDDEEKIAFYTNQENHHEVESKKVFIWGRRRKIHGIHGHLRRDTGQSKEDEGNYIYEIFWTLREMQSLSGKLVALKRFLYRSAKRSVPFFQTLKDITKENKDEYRWTEEAKKAFHEMKKVIVKLLLLTTPQKEETLYVYLAATKEAVSVVLLMEWNGKQCPIHYVSKTLNEAEKNYAPLEKLALSLLHMSRRLRRYFEAHPIKLGMYNITYKPRNAIKGQVLADFLLEALEGTKTEGSDVGLVLIILSGMEFTYALRLNFTSTNSDADYEALLARLRMAAKMKVHVIDVKVDSKLVASQINGNYVANSTNMIKYLATAKESFDHLTKEVLVEALSKRSTDRKEVWAIVEEEKDN